MSPTPMHALEDLIVSIGEPDAEVARAVQAHLDRKTKPLGSLGRLEALACRYCAARGDDSPQPPVKALVVMAADHGVAAEGVSAYPQEVTRQMLLNFASGGAAINVLARQAQARLIVVDMGVLGGPVPGVRDCRIAQGTASIVHGPAMSRAQAIDAIGHGVRIARELAGDGVTLLGVGDMGIGNTTAASALLAAFAGRTAEGVVGRGTGIDDAGLARKRDAIASALHHAPEASDALGVLAALGGFEIAGMAGLMLSASAVRVPVVVDGFIASAAALAAVRIAPQCRGFLIASHRSAERAHAQMLDAVGIDPLFDLDLRLGEGSGAALAMPLVDAAVAILREMATFESAGVSERSDR